MKVNHCRQTCVISLPETGERKRKSDKNMRCWARQDEHFAATAQKQQQRKIAIKWFLNQHTNKKGNPFNIRHTGTKANKSSRVDESDFFLHIDKQWNITIKNEVLTTVMTKTTTSTTTSTQTTASRCKCMKKVNQMNFVSGINTYARTSLIRAKVMSREI